MKVAICIGHSRRGDDGAVSLSGASEYQFNRELGRILHDTLLGRNHHSYLYDFYEGVDYAIAMHWIAEQINGADVALELHFNSSDSSKANGHEWLYWHASYKSKCLAHWLDAKYDDFPLYSRGILPRHRSDRGALFLRATKCPAVICEPFFGSNKKTGGWASTHKKDMALALADALSGWGLEMKIK